MVTPGSNRVLETIKRDGLLEVFEDVGATVLANACGPCIGQWKRDDIEMGDTNTIISSYNRNFRGRNDQNRETLSFLMSPEVVTAMTFSGELGFNPLTDRNRRLRIRAAGGRAASPGWILQLGRRFRRTPRRWGRHPGRDRRG